MMPIPANPTNASIQPQSLYDARADLARRAMLTEVNLSPKPGLVDRLNCGAHKDMALADFHRSAEAIRHWLPRFMEYGASCTRLPPESVLAGLRPWGWPVKPRCFAQQRASIPIKAAFSRWGYCAPPLAACISYASRSPQKPSALPPPILPRPDHARTAPEQPTAHRRSAAVSATGINRRAR